MEDKELKNILHHLKLYFMMSTKYIKARSQYRADFIIGMLAVLLDSLLGVIALWILFHSGSTLAGWSFQELFFIYSFIMISTGPVHLMFNHLWSLPYYVRSGHFMKYYCKPMNMLVYFIGDSLEIKNVGGVPLGIAGFIYASISIGIQWTFFKVVLLLLFLLGSGLILSAVLLITASVSLIINTDLGAIMHFFMRFFEFAKYPATIFKGFIKFLITCIVPAAFIGFYPALFFLRPQEGNFLMYATPVIGIVMFIGAYQVWKIGVHRYSGTGT
jgi:ABC-2 type transport system permease protein